MDRDNARTQKNDEYKKVNPYFPRLGNYLSLFILGIDIFFISIALLSGLLKIG